MKRKGGGGGRQVDRRAHILGKGRKKGGSKGHDEWKTTETRKHGSEIREKWEKKMHGSNLN